MPISGEQNLDKNDPDYGLPLDTCCVGMGGPSPMEAAVISRSGGRGLAQAAASGLRIQGGPTPLLASRVARGIGKAAAQGGGMIPSKISGLTGDM